MPFVGSCSFLFFLKGEGKKEIPVVVPHAVQNRVVMFGHRSSVRLSYLCLLLVPEIRNESCSSIGSRQRRPTALLSSHVFINLSKL